MNDEQAEKPASPARASMNKPFRRKFDTVRLAPDALERQIGITRLAWSAMGTDAAILFLNNHSEPLSGRPLDVAIASATGYEAVARAISAQSAAE
ncbi:hypothetical protein [Sphingomonas sp. IW22]|uniref:hypothetical protein n=1 Tax=Sphingomonas sp. IW22 TaxID=3242489 RepID=UPI0035200CF7